MHENNIVSDIFSEGPKFRPHASLGRFKKNLLGGSGGGAGWTGMNFGTEQAGSIDINFQVAKKISIFR